MAKTCGDRFLIWRLSVPYYQNLWAKPLRLLPSRHATHLGHSSNVQPWDCQRFVGSVDMAQIKAAPNPYMCHGTDSDHQCVLALSFPPRDISMLSAGMDYSGTRHEHQSSSAGTNEFSPTCRLAAKPQNLPQNHKRRHLCFRTESQHKCHAPQKWQCPACKHLVAQATRQTLIQLLHGRITAQACKVCQVQVKYGKAPDL